MNVRHDAYRLRGALYPVAALSLLAGLIHLWRNRDARNSTKRANNPNSLKRSAVVLTLSTSAGQRFSKIEKLTS
jgi:hypothetical protein